jgi:hypothetical protein
MHLSDETQSPRDTLFIPAFASFYDQLAQPLAWVVLRLAVGGMLMVEGWPKIMAPLAQTGFVESLGFYLQQRGALESKDRNSRHGCRHHFGQGRRERAT